MAVPSGSKGLRQRGRPSRLTAESITVAALAVIDERGVERCTIRAVAERLGASPMSLYRHVESKEALLARIPDALTAPVTAEVMACVDAIAALRAVANELSEVILAHPGVARLFDQPVPGPNMTAAAEHCVTLLMTTGRSSTESYTILRAVVAQVIGEIITSHGSFDPAGVDLLLSAVRTN